MICIIILATAAVIGYGYTRSDFMFLSEIEPGMTGVGKTIVSGDTISEFNVSVIGVIDEPGDASDFIVVRFCILVYSSYSQKSRFLCGSARCTQLPLRTVR